MKRKIICICLLGLIILSGCSSDTPDAIDASNTSDVSEVNEVDKTTTTTANTTEENTMSDINSEIMNILGCNEFEACMISEVLEECGLTGISSIEKNTSADDNSLIVVANSVTYEVGVGKQYGVYCIKDTSADKIIYAVYE